MTSLGALGETRMPLVQGSCPLMHLLSGILGSLSLLLHPPLFSPCLLWTSSICFSVHGCLTTYNVTCPQLMWPKDPDYAPQVQVLGQRMSLTHPSSGQQLQWSAPVWEVEQLGSNMALVGYDCEEGSVSKHSLLSILLNTQILKEVKFLLLLLL